METESEPLHLEVPVSKLCNRRLLRAIVPALLIVSVPVSLYGAHAREPQLLTNGMSMDRGGRHDVSLQELSRMPMSFTENCGQWDDSVCFRTQVGNVTAWYTGSSVYYQFTRYLEGKRADTRSDIGHRSGRGVEQLVVTTSLVGANPSALAVGEGIMGQMTNYYVGNAPAKWQTDVPSYQSIRVEEVYPGIDLRYYGSGGRLEYDFVVHPGADLSRIQIRYTGAKSLVVGPGGDLLVETPWGRMGELKPIIYVEEGGLRKSVPGEFVLIGGNTFGFELTGDYPTDVPLVIDPVMLLSSTFLGGTAWDFSVGIGLDDAGNIYTAGRTTSADFPLANAFDPTHNGGTDFYVAKFLPSGGGLIYSTYLGGSGTEEHGGLFVDSSGNAYLTGTTNSSDFPTTANALQTAYAGGVNDALAAKLDPSGVLIYCTYLGSSGDDGASGIAADAAGNAYVAGSAGAADFPLVNPYQGTWQGGYHDCFVAKLNPTGTALLYSTFLGGSSDDDPMGIALDNSGNFYVTGETSSGIIGQTSPGDFPTTPGAFDRTYNGGTFWTGDVFVTKFSPSGDQLLYSTYLGTGGDDYGTAIAVDAVGSAFVTGITDGTGFPTMNPYDGTLSGPYDMFVTKLNPAGSALVYSTYLGGNGGDGAGKIALDLYGNAYVAGSTSSPDFPTVEPYSGTLNGPSDAFVTAFAASGNALVFSTFLGGSADDWGGPIAISQDGIVHVAGSTQSSDFPTRYAYDSTYNGGRDAFLAEFFIGCPPPRPPDACWDRKADVNCDGVEDVFDVIYLIDYVFSGGPPRVLCPQK